MSPFRSSDGVCAAGTVVVSRLKMGEMEEVDVDHITTDVPPQKVNYQGDRTKQEPLCTRCLELMPGLDWHFSSPSMRLSKLQ